MLPSLLSMYIIKFVPSKLFTITFTLVSATTRRENIIFMTFLFFKKNTIVLGDTISAPVYVLTHSCTNQINPCQINTHPFFFSHDLTTD